MTTRITTSIKPPTIRMPGLARLPDAAILMNLPSGVSGQRPVAPSLNLTPRGANGARTAFPAVRAHGLLCAGLPARIGLGAEWHAASHSSAGSRCRADSRLCAPLAGLTTACWHPTLPVEGDPA